MKVLKIVKVYKNTIIYFLTALLYFQPARYVLGDSPARIWNWTLLLVSAAYVAVYGMRFRYARLRKPDVGILALVAAHVYCLVIASFLNPQTSDFRGGFIYAAMLVGFAAYIRVGISRSPKQLFQGYTAAGVLMCGIHLLTILLYQNNGGMRKGISSSLGRSYSDNWFFLGHANASFYVVFPLIVMFFIYAYQFNRRLVKAAYAFLAFTLFCFFVQWTLAGLLSCAAFSALLFLDSVPSAGASRIVKKALNLRMIWIVTLAVETFLGLFSGLSRYTDFLLEYFNKGQSISARLGVWANSVYYIMQKPLFGNGWNYETVAVSRITRSHTHNILIEFLYCGGIFAVILFLFAVEYLQRQIDTRGRKFYSSKAARVGMYAIIPYVLASTFDYYMYRYHSLMLYIALWYLMTESGQTQQEETADDDILQSPEMRQP